MLIFIDESGDPGFRIDRGASPVFVVAMVIFAATDDATRTQAVIERSKAREIHKSEFKFSKCSNDVRDLFFETVQECSFLVRAIVVRKETIYSPRLKADKDRFYEFFVKMMLSHDSGIMKNAKIIIDGSGDRTFRKNLNSALRRRLREGAIRDVRFKDSKNDVLVQLADMCAGAIGRSYRDRKDNNRWREMLAPRINDIWEFK
jgi:hypothetical protein